MWQTLLTNLIFTFCGAVPEEAHFFQSLALEDRKHFMRVIRNDPELFDRTFEGPEQLLVCDINNDGKKDIIVSAGYSYEVGVYLQNSPVDFTLEHSYSCKNNCEQLFLADINSDGRPDVMSTGFSDSIMIFFNQSALK
jgi:hypothetical protein